MIPIRDSVPSRTFPLVTVVIIALNICVFLYEILLDDYSQNYFVSVYAMVPARFHASSLLTSMFLHGGILHLLGNMLFLWVFGDNIEDILGRFKYLFFYLACGVAAGLMHLMFNLDSRLPTVGASGAIAGVMGAYMVKFPHAKIKMIFWFILIFTYELPAWLVLAYWFLIQLVSGVGALGQANVQQGGVAWFAHIGGFVAGALLIKILPSNSATRWRYEPTW